VLCKEIGTGHALEIGGGLKVEPHVDFNEPTKGSIPLGFKSSTNRKPQRRNSKLGALEGQRRIMKKRAQKELQVTSRRCGSKPKNSKRTVNI
jgi:hypothetical protein